MKFLNIEQPAEGRIVKTKENEMYTIEQIELLITGGAMIARLQRRISAILSVLFEYEENFNNIPPCSYAIKVLSTVKKDYSGPVKIEISLTEVDKGEYAIYAKVFGLTVFHYKKKEGVSVVNLVYLARYHQAIIKGLGCWLNEHAHPLGFSTTSPENHALILVGQGLTKVWDEDVSKSKEYAAELSARK